MGNPLIAAALNAGAAVACAAVAVFFARFWRESRDRLFLCLSGGFALLGANYGLLAVLVPVDERRPYAFLLRLIGLLTILIGILVKDRDYADSLHVDDDDPPFAV